MMLPSLTGRRGEITCQGLIAVLGQGGIWSQVCDPSTQALCPWSHQQRVGNCVSSHHATPEPALTPPPSSDFRQVSLDLSVTADWGVVRDQPCPLHWEGAPPSQPALNTEVRQVAESPRPGPLHHSTWPCPPDAA